MIRSAAIAALEELWSYNVHDETGAPPDARGNRLITELFDSNGWAKWLRSMEPGHGNCPDGYMRPPDPDYCGHGTAWGFRRLGEMLQDPTLRDVGLRRDICQRMLASTRRLADLGTTTWAELGVPDPHLDVARADELLEPGDVVVVVTGANKSYGDHIVTATSRVDAQGMFATIESNARGVRADGSVGKGVVKSFRRLEDVRQLIRFDAAHCEGFD